MSKVLVKFEKDWADEFSIYGFAVYEKSDWESAIEKFKNATSFSCFYFGTNEGWDNDQIEEEKDQWLNAYEIEDISEEEFKVLSKLFGSPFNESVSFGTFCSPLELISEEQL